MTDGLQSGHVTARVNGAVGFLALDRPDAMNALTLSMVRDLTKVLRHWASASEVQAVVIAGRARESGQPVFCAGGDLRFLHHCATHAPSDLAAFFDEEYALNHLIHHYAKPVLALMDGPVMGGGMGLAQGAKLRVVSDHSLLGMPETRIGLTPDVGANWWLSQLPGHVGEWLSVTGQCLSAGDAVELGLADVYVPAAEWSSMVDELTEGAQPSAEHVVATVMERAALAPTPEHLGHRQEIDQCFALATLQDIDGSVRRAPDSAWARITQAHLDSNSPLMMGVSLALLRRSRGLGLADVLRLERTVMHHAWAPAAQGLPCDALEGIRALSLDKDRAPRWRPAEIQAVTEPSVDAHFVDAWSPASHPLASLR